VRQERGGHGGLGVEVREPAGHHLAVVAVVVMAVVVAVMVAVMVHPTGVSVGGKARRRSSRPGRRRRHRRLRVLRRDGRHGGRGAPVAVGEAQKLLYGERRPLRHRLVFGGRAHRAMHICTRRGRRRRCRRRRRSRRSRRRSYACTRELMCRDLHHRSRSCFTRIVLYTFARIQYTDMILL